MKQEDGNKQIESSIELLNIMKLPLPQRSPQQQQYVLSYLLAQSKFFQQFTPEYINHQSELRTSFQNEILFDRLSPIQNIFCLFQGEIELIPGSTLLSEAVLPLSELELSFRVWNYKARVLSSSCFLITLPLFEFRKKLPKQLKEFNLPKPKLEVLQTIKMLQNLSTKYLSNLATSINVVYTENQEALYVYFIAQGQFQVSKKIFCNSKRNLELAVIDKGNLFGHEELNFDAVQQQETLIKRQFNVSCFTDNGALVFIDIQCKKIFKFWSSSEQNEFLAELKNSLNWRKELIDQQTRTLQQYFLLSPTENQSPINLYNRFSKPQLSVYDSPQNTQEFDDDLTKNFIDNHSCRKINRRRIVSIPEQDFIQASEVNNSKKAIFSKLNTKNSDFTFVAVYIKPNLALLRQKGFHELNRVENVIKQSFRNPKNKSHIQNQMEKKESRFSPVKFSQLILDRSQSIVSVIIFFIFYGSTTQLKKISSQQVLPEIFIQKRNSEKEKKYLKRFQETDLQ